MFYFKFISDPELPNSGYGIIFPDPDIVNSFDLDTDQDPKHWGKHFQALVNSIILRLYNTIRYLMMQYNILLYNTILRKKESYQIVLVP